MASLRARDRLVEIPAIKRVTVVAGRAKVNGPIRWGRPVQAPEVGPFKRRISKRSNGPRPRGDLRRRFSLTARL
jgi:hypothetical protein